MCAHFQSMSLRRETLRRTVWVRTGRRMTLCVFLCACLYVCKCIGVRSWEGDDLEGSRVCVICCCDSEGVIGVGGMPRFVCAGGARKLPVPVCLHTSARSPAHQAFKCKPSNLVQGMKSCMVVCFSACALMRGAKSTAETHASTCTGKKLRHTLACRNEKEYRMENEWDGWLAEQVR